ncbi:uncharacterized protein LOC122511590 [Leptopilina heterotoma]|uniref:uncharacterized protein LOC122511590 n=1 Tax=Leptopilina heterotoma TaxID=63436 RepID=UPI001CA847A2|nr:uncharacterized protein LOC122511590 [Leptopilina heterotoma]
MRYFIHFLVILGLLVITISGQPCRREGFSCVATRECCASLQCSIQDRKCLGRFTCRQLGQYCTSDVNCCSGLRCHQLRQRCVRADEICQKLGQTCDPFNRCCFAMRCSLGRCVY